MTLMLDKQGTIENVVDDFMAGVLPSEGIWVVQDGYEESTLWFLDKEREPLAKIIKNHNNKNVSVWRTEV